MDNIKNFSSYDLLCLLTNFSWKISINNEFFSNCAIERFPQIIFYAYVARDNIKVTQSDKA